MKELVCGKCGSTIPIGVVFCPVCGTKADLDGVDNKRTSGFSVRAIFSRIRWGIISLIIITALLVISGLAICPYNKCVGKQGGKQSAEIFINQVKTIKNLSAGINELSIVLTEKEINSYLKNIRIPNIDMDFCCVQIMNDKAHIRSGREVGPFHLLKFTFNIKLTADIWYQYNDNKLSVSKAKLGHLPLFGKYRKILADKMQTAVLGAPDKNPWLKRIKDIKLQDKKIVLEVH